MAPAFAAPGIPDLPPEPNRAYRRRCVTLRRRRFPGGRRLRRGQIAQLNNGVVRLGASGHEGQRHDTDPSVLIVSSYPE